MQIEGAWDQAVKIMADFASQGYFFEVLLILVAFVVGYFFIFPVGVGVMIAHLHKGKLGPAMIE